MAKSNNKIICMIAQASYPGDPRIRRQAEALDKAGFEVDVLCRPSGSQKKVEKFGKVTAYRLVNAPRQDSIVKWIYYSSLFFVMAFIKIQFLYVKRKYNVIQIHNMPDHLIFSAIVQKIFKVPLVIDIHDLTVEMFQEKWQGKKRPIIIGLAKFLEKISLTISNKVITVTTTCKERLVSRGISPDKITLILNTPNEDVFEFDKNRIFITIEKDLRLVYYGTVAKRFGIHVAVQAMPAILEKIPGSQFDIYGPFDAEYGNFLEELIRNKGLENNVSLKEKVTREKIPGIIRNSDIGLVPYLSSDYMHLALPTKAFEYIAAGLPVVSTFLEDLSKSFSNNSITYVKSEDPEDLAKKICFLSQNPDIRKAMTLNAYNEMREISGQVMSKRYVDLMSSLNSI